MSTRGYIGITQNNGTVKFIYCHNDSMIDGLGILLYKYYNTEELAEKLINMGNVSSVHSTLSSSKFYKEQNFIGSLLDFLCENEPDIEWVYLFDKDKGKWYAGSCWNGCRKSNLVPLGEALGSKTILEHWFKGVIYEDCINDCINHCIKAAS